MPALSFTNVKYSSGRRKRLVSTAIAFIGLEQFAEEFYPFCVIYGKNLEQ